MSTKSNKKKISRNGLAKWTVVNAIDPGLAQELAEDTFYLAAWEAYWLWKKNPKNEKHQTLKWNTTTLHWSELTQWEALKANPSEDNENAYLGLNSNYELLERWERFYKKWSGEKFFDQSKVFVVGQPSFTSVDQCEAYKFLNQVIVSREKSDPAKEKTSNDEVPIVNGYRIGPGEDLREANLLRAILARANLKGAFLFRANLMEANLVAANLFEADLSEANLVGATLDRADLKESLLNGSRLVGANLNRVDLREANLEKARLDGANLNGALLDRAFLGEANLRGVRLIGASMKKADIYKVNFRDAVFSDHEILLAINWQTAFFNDGVKERLIEMSSKGENNLS